MHQFFLDNDLLTLNEGQIHQCRSVLKLNKKDVIRVVTPSGKVYCARFNDQFSGALTDLQEVALPVMERPRLTIAAALIRMERLEWMIEKATELGVDRLVLFPARRCVVRIDAQKRLRKQQRWQSIAKEAAEQSQRLKVPEIILLDRFERLIDYREAVNLVAYEAEREVPLSTFLRKENTIAVVGPEGGFDAQEVHYLVQHGYSVCSLGVRILRAETASIALCDRIATYLEA